MEGRHAAWVVLPLVKGLWVPIQEGPQASLQGALAKAPGSFRSTLFRHDGSVRGRQLAQGCTEIMEPLGSGVAVPGQVAGWVSQSLFPVGSPSTVYPLGGLRKQGPSKLLVTALTALTFLQQMASSEWMRP